MSEYKNNDLFLEPKTTQYGSHIIMSNVNKSAKTKFINIDTRFRDEYNYLQPTNYIITLPERINDVKNIKVISAEIPISFYNISASLGNNCFKISDTNVLNSDIIITLPDGQYGTVTLYNAINSQLNSKGLSSNFVYNLSGQTYDVSGTSSQFIAKNAKSYKIDFAINANGTLDKFNIKSKLGWLIGYRLPTYTINASTSANSIISEGLIDINGPRYLYLALEEFNKGIQSSVVPGLFNSMVNKNIIARIQLNKNNYDFGKILPVNIYNGLLTSDIRSYSGKIDLLKINVQLLNEFGSPIVLNGMDFSLYLEVTYE
jgi:hypothetical protein